MPEELDLLERRIRQLEIERKPAARTGAILRWRSPTLNPNSSANSPLC
jgi:hypothetical protein